MTPFYDDGQITILCADLRDMPLSELAGAAACVVTSPPYNVGVDYHSDPTSDLLPWGDYWDLADTTARLISRALVPAGRVWVNTAVSVPVVPTRPLGPQSGSTAKRRVLLARGWADALELGGGLCLVDQVAWCSVRGSGTAWGSWQSPGGPNLRGDYEVITVACNGAWQRPAPAGLEGWRDGMGGWPDLCSTVWTLQPEARAGHPAPFPIELAARCIRLSTWPGETVLDPFAGSGTTLLAARALGRRAIGVERSEQYCALAVQRLAQGALDFGGAA